MNVSVSRLTVQNRHDKLQLPVKQKRYLLKSASAARTNSTRNNQIVEADAPPQCPANIHGIGQ